MDSNGCQHARITVSLDSISIMMVVYILLVGAVVDDASDGVILQPSPLDATNSHTRHF